MLSDAQRLRFERQLKAAFAAANDGQAEALLALLGNPPVLSRVPDTFWRGIGNELMRTLEPILVEAAVASAVGLGRKVGAAASVNWSLVNIRAERWAHSYSFNLVKGITDNSRSRLSRMVARFISDGTTDLKTLGEQAGSLFGSERGSTIATTEATRAAAQGDQVLVAEIRAENPNVRVNEIWLTSQDEITCPECFPLHGKTRGDGWTEPPPRHPRCRCTTSISLIGLEKGEPADG